jgi:hypothetical protein
VTAVFPRLRVTVRVPHLWGFIKSRAVRLASGVVIMAPPKPSVQTQFVLSRMQEREEQDEARWNQVTDSLDMLFAKVG